MLRVLTYSLYLQFVLLICENVAGCPDLPKGDLGPQSKFSELGLSCVSHPKPEINLDTNELKVDIRFTKPIKATETLTQCSKNKDIPQHVFTETRSDIVSFRVSLPAAGFYKLSLFALSLHDDNKRLPVVYNYLINCTKATGPVELYPKQYAQWNKGCYMNEPVSLSSRSNLNNVKFEVGIAGVQAVAVVAEGEWTHLQKATETGNIWEGFVNLEQYKGNDSKVTLVANYGTDSIFSTLLEYRV